ncbi:MAG: GPR endopeptidase, partial [Oscillospiraceae bacterium]
TRHVLNGVSSSNGLNSLQSVSAIAPGVLGQTGIETSQIIRSICNEIKPSCVIVIDALASKSISRLGRTIQISNTGISPGSGVQNSRSELSKKTLGVPVICVGVPTVVDMATIAKDILGVGETENGENMMVTPREIDLVIEHAAKTVAFSVNLALQPSLTLQDLVALAC